MVMSRLYEAHALHKLSTRHVEGGSQLEHGQPVVVLPKFRCLVANRNKNYARNREARVFRTMVERCRDTFYAFYKDVRARLACCWAASTICGILPSFAKLRCMHQVRALARPTKHLSPGTFQRARQTRKTGSCNKEALAQILLRFNSPT